MKASPKKKPRLLGVVHGAFAQAGSLPGEDPNELSHLRQDILSRLLPAPGLEAELAEQLVQVVVRLRRVERAERLVVGHSAERYLMDGPVEPAPHVDRKDPMAHIKVAPRRNPRDLHERHRALRKEVERIDGQLEMDREALADLAAAKKVGPASVRASLEGWIRFWSGIPEELRHPAFDEIVACSSCVDGAAFRTALRNAARRQRRRRTRLEAEMEAIEERVVGLFAGGHGDLIDPGAPSLTRLEQHRTRLLRQVERLQRAIAQARALRAAVPETAKVLPLSLAPEANSQ